MRPGGYQLEDYIFEVETRPPDTGGHRIMGSSGHQNRTPVSDPTASDLWQQLQQKEADLVLAAELGKALLEKNEELARQQERLAEEYCAKLEALEQDKHSLRRSLSLAQGEAEARTLELQADVAGLTQRLRDQENELRGRRREEGSLVSELAAQNARLTTQLQEAAQTERELSEQLQALRDQYSVRNHSLQDHVSSLESLRDELRMLTDKKADLERRLAASLVERAQLGGALEEASDRIMALERQLREQDTKHRQTTQELDRLQRENDTLTERLESSHHGSHVHGGIGSSYARHAMRSLLCEMECNDEEGHDGAGNDGPMMNVTEETLQVYRRLRGLVTQLRSAGRDDDSGLHSDLSLDSPMITDSSFASSSPPPSSTPSTTNIPTTTTSPLLPPPSTPPSQSVTACHQLPAGALSEVTSDLVRLVLALDAVHYKALLDDTQAALQDKEQLAATQQEQICDLQTKLSVCDVELRGAMEERDRARHDASHSSLQQDEVVAQAREVRDAAVARKTKAEVDLARTRVELMQANSQLLESIQQKVELAQQLEQWQMDMQELIGEQMKNKLLSERNLLKATPIPTKKSNRLFNLFQR